MNWENIIISTSVGVVTGLLGFIGGRAKNKAEAKQAYSDALSKDISSLRLIIESWQEHADSLELQVDKQDKIIKAQDEKIKVQDEKIMKLQSKIEELSKQINLQCKTCNLKT